MSLRMLSLKQVVAETGNSANSIRAWVEAGRFPHPVYLPSGEKRWLEVDVIRWQMGLSTTPPENPVKTNLEAHRGSQKLTETQSGKTPKNVG